MGEESQGEIMEELMRREFEVVKAKILQLQYKVDVLEKKVAKLEKGEE